VAILYIFPRLGILCLEKSGNPGFANAKCGLKVCPSKTGFILYVHMYVHKDKSSVLNYAVETYCSLYMRF
jgi:hypothetical protein